MGAAGASIWTWPLLEINIKERRGAPTLKGDFASTSKEWLLGIPYFSVVLRAHSLNCAVGSDLGTNFVGKSLAVSSRR